MRTEGAGDRTRTGDVQLGKLAFYQLNYAREVVRGAPTLELAIVPRKSQRSGLNRRPLDYESSALPLSYAGGCSSYPIMPWRGLEPRRLAAPPPQDGVSTNFTTRARDLAVLVQRVTGLTGLEPATSGVTDRHSNQLSYSPNYETRSERRRPATRTRRSSPNGSRTRLCTLKECRPNR
jgi:hypothetical protein